MRLMHRCGLWAVLALGLALPVFALQPKSPDMVKMGLRILAGVYGDMDRKLAAGQYERLPHENEEFQEGSGALKDAIVSEPADAKAQIQTSLDAALAAANHVAEASKTHDKAQVKAALDELSTALHKLNGLFPKALRSEPGTVMPHRPQSAPHPAGS